MTHNGHNPLAERIRKLSDTDLIASTVTAWRDYSVTRTADDRKRYDEHAWAALDRGLMEQCQAELKRQRVEGTATKR